jgi:hypothetical protein
MASGRPRSIRDGTPVLIRPLVAEDAGLYPYFLSDESREGLRLRFFARISEVNTRTLWTCLNVRFWHKADILEPAINDRFRG